MANENVKISGPVKIVSDSTARVAYDLMKFIASDEINIEKGATTFRDRDYYLTLYRQCYKAADGSLLVTILKKED